MSIADVPTPIQNSPIAHAISKSDPMVAAGLQAVHVPGIIMLLASLALVSWFGIGFAGRTIGFT